MHLRREEHVVALRVLCLLGFVVRLRLAMMDESLACLYAWQPRRATTRLTRELLLRAFRGLNWVRVHLVTVTLQPLPRTDLGLLELPLDTCSRLLCDFAHSDSKCPDCRLERRRRHVRRERPSEPDWIINPVPLVRCGDIRVIPSYHRPVDRGFVEAVKQEGIDTYRSKDSVSYKCSLPFLNRREDGNLYLIDGRRCLTVVRELYGEDALAMVGIWPESMSLPEEALHFILRNTCRKAHSVEKLLRLKRELDAGSGQAMMAQILIQIRDMRENLSPEDLRRAQGCGPSS